MFDDLASISSIFACETELSTDPSVGQAYHEGEKFLATMDLINETFSSCNLMLCDTLQKHSFRIKDNTLSESAAYEKAYKLGNAWLLRNRHAYENLTIPLKLYRWDDWLTHDDYDHYRQEITSIYQHNTEFRTSIIKTIETFLSRHPELKLCLDSYNRAYQLSEEYLLEECPVLIPLWAELKSQFVVYPRFRTKAMAATYDLYLSDAQRPILKEVALKFNHRVKPKTLSFA